MKNLWQTEHKYPSDDLKYKIINIAIPLRFQIITTLVWRCILFKWVYVKVIYKWKFFYPVIYYIQTSSAFRKTVFWSALPIPLKIYEHFVSFIIFILCVYVYIVWFSEHCGPEGINCFTLRKTGYTNVVIYIEYENRKQ